MKRFGWLKVLGVPIACLAMVCASPSAFAQRGGGGHMGGGGFHGGGFGGGGFHGGGGVRGGYGGWGRGGWGGWRGGYYPGYGWGFGLGFGLGWGWDSYWYPDYPYYGYYPYAAYPYAPYPYYYPANPNPGYSYSPNSYVYGGSANGPGSSDSVRFSNPSTQNGSPGPAPAAGRGNLGLANLDENQVRELHQLAPERRRVLENTIATLQAMPPSARQRQIDSGRFNSFSPQEQELLKTVFRMPPPKT
jgi:hypothetical protein